MSVVQDKRQESPVEFVNTANELFKKTVTYMTYLSARFSRIFVPKITDIAIDVLNNAEEANAIFPKKGDMVAINLRKEYTLRAKAALESLSTMTKHTLDILIDNPQGAMVTKQSQKVMEPAQAKDKLGNASQELGDLINKERSLLDGQLKMLERIEKES